jgi:thiamine pyrophosphate-dependent acetolactate synthase large subunit-like protein
MNGAGRGTLPPGDPHHFQLSRRYAFSNADVIVIVGTPFDFRMGYGKRLSPDATVVQIDLDYRTVGKNRDIGLGVGVPFVLAAKQARPDKEVVALFGDGAFSLTGWDFETLVRYDLPFVGIVGNNSSMNQIRYGQKAKYGAERERVGNTLGDVHYDKFAQMLGGYGEEVRDPADIGPALRRARESGKPSLINVWVDPDAYAPGTMNQTMYK